MKKNFSILFCTTLILLNASITHAKDNKYDFYLFYSITCSYCTKARQFIRELKEKYPETSFHELEIVKTRKNQELFMELNEHLNITVPGVPIFIFGDDYLVGFKDNELSRMKVVGMIERQLSIQSPRTWKNSKGNPFIERLLTRKNNTTAPALQGKEILVPLAGKINPQSISLPLFTLFFGLVDGINPCAMWVLMFLLTLLVNTHDRKKLLIVGTVFVFSSGVVYLLFMIAWLNIFTIFGIRQSATVVFAVIIISIGLINVKELFFFKRGLSLMIPDRAKPKIITKMRNIIENPDMLLSIAGTASLAFFVNLIEFGCTIGLPALYTKVLSYQNISIPSKYMYTVLYNIAYTIPLFFIVVLFAVTLGKYDIQEKHGKLLKGISGVLMLVLGILLIASPRLLEFSRSGKLFY